MLPKGLSKQSFHNFNLLYKALSVRKGKELGVLCALYVSFLLKTFYYIMHYTYLYVYKYNVYLL